MNKNILSLAFVAISLFGTVQVANALPFMEHIETEQQGPQISLIDNALHITGGAGMVLEIYNVAGVRVNCSKIDSQDKRVELSLSKGCYIVKVGKTVRKISLK